MLALDVTSKTTAHVLPKRCRNKPPENFHKQRFMVQHKMAVQCFLNYGPQKYRLAFEVPHHLCQTLWSTSLCGLLTLLHPVPGRRDLFSSLTIGNRYPCAYGIIGKIVKKRTLQYSGKNWEIEVG
jgi:hypothetical protein